MNIRRKIIVQISGPRSLSQDAVRYELPKAFYKAKASFLKKGGYVIHRYSLAYYNNKMGLKSLFMWEIFYSPLILYYLAKRGFDMLSCGLMGWMSFLALVFAKMTGKPVVVGDDHWYWPNTFFAKLHYPFSRIMAKHATLLYLTRGASVFWRKGGVPVKRMRVGFPPDYVPKLEINEEDILRAEEFKKHLGLEGKTVILFFGRMMEKKGIEYLIKAFQKISDQRDDVFLLLCGEGPQRVHLQNLCMNLGVRNVHFFGFVKPEDKNALFLICDIFVYPSVTLAIPEEWPLAVCEAMSVGKPVIVTNAVGSVKDGLVKHGVNGFIVPEKNVEALFIAIERLLRDKELLARMGENARRTIYENFAYSKGFNLLREVWEEAISTCYK